MPSAATCPSCGAPVASGRHGCQLLFDEMLAADFSDYRRMPYHRLLVDLYSLQHPNRYCKSAKSFAAHLTGLCCVIEHGGSRQVNAAVQRWLSTAPSIDKPTLPREKGTITVLHVSAQPDIDEYGTRLEEWARDVWKAYSGLQPLARDWIEAAVGRRPGS